MGYYKFWRILNILEKIFKIWKYYTPKKFKKLLIIFLISAVAILVLKTKSRAEFTATDSLNLSSIMFDCTQITGQLNTINSNIINLHNDNNVLVTYLQSISSNVTDINSSLNTYLQYLENLNEISAEITNLKNEIINLQTINNNIIKAINNSSSNIVNTIISENQKLLDAINGSDEKDFSDFSKVGNIVLNYFGGTPYVGKYFFNFQKQYTYDINISFTNTTSTPLQIFYILSENNYNDRDTVLNSDTAFELGLVPANSSTTFTITNNDTNKKFLYIWWPSRITDISVSSSILGLTSAVTDTGNKLNDTLTDSNASYKNQLPTNNTNDITENGFNNIFNTVRNAFLNPTGKEITITIPWVDYDLVISKDILFGQLEGFSSFETIINNIWLASVSIYIVKDISIKIGKIKSGNFDSLQNSNIKEDLL